VHKVFWWRNLREGDYFKDSGAGERIILKRILRSGMGHGKDGSGSG
jgi:hypothetical protein